MSRTTSDGSAGPRPVARPSNNAYTVLLVIALLVLAGTIFCMVSVNNNRFGYAMPMGEDYENAGKLVDDFTRSVKADAQVIQDSLEPKVLDARLTGTGAVEVKNEENAE